MMPGGESTMILNVFLQGAGHHEAAWRYSAAQPQRIFAADYFHSLARTAERAALHAVFFGDGPVLGERIDINSVARIEPITTLASIAAVTSRIGLIATASTTYNEPYNLARLFASLDHLSSGRSGWNIVTTNSAAAARNFGFYEHPDPETRYARADEFVRTVTALWDSWDDDAIVLDRRTGRYADTSKIHPVDVRGEYVSVAGPLNIPRPPQGHPVLVQAGASNSGRRFAGAHAEVIFSAHQELGQARQFYADIAEQARAAGRDPDAVKILPGLSPYIADTEAAARQLKRDIDANINPEYGLTQIGRLTGKPVDGLELDAPVPAELFADNGTVTDNSRSRLQVVGSYVATQRPTLRELIAELAGARGHRVVVGTPETVADTMILWFRSGAADGFNIMPPYFPGGLETFVDQVVPILRDRGVFRTEYTGTTLRENLGLKVPAARAGRVSTDVGVR